MHWKQLIVWLTRNAAWIVHGAEKVSLVLLIQSEFLSKSTNDALTTSTLLTSLNSSVLKSTSKYGAVPDLATAQIWDFLFPSQEHRCILSTNTSFHWYSCRNSVVPIVILFKRQFICYRPVHAPSQSGGTVNTSLMWCQWKKSTYGKVRIVFIQKKKHLSKLSNIIETRSMLAYQTYLCQIKVAFFI